ncbi:MAG: hypothetical protein ACRCZR_07990, partial [Cetobacterium sp.]
CCLFSDYEKNKILVSKNIIKNHEEFLLDNKENLKKYKEKINEKNKNDKRRVFQSGAPAYHKNSSCEKLSNDYTNYIISKTVPEEKIEEYKEWFKRYLPLFVSRENKNIETSNKKMFSDKHKEKWGEEIEFPDYEEKKNSGVEKISLERINEIKKEIREICKNVESNDRGIFKKKLKDSFIAELNSVEQITNSYIKKYAKELSEIHKKKQELINVLVNALLEESSGNNFFSSEILNIAGFKACSCCKNGLNDL